MASQGLVGDQEPPADELFIGIVRAVGTETTGVIGELTGHLHTAGYHVEQINIGKFLDGSRPTNHSTQYHTLQIKRMDEGDRARQDRHDALALRAIKSIDRRRQKALDSTEVRTTRLAYILDPIVHPAEVLTLRTVYGRHFFLVSLYQDEEARRDQLLSRIEQSAEGENSEAIADEIMERDRGKGDEEHKIAIGRTFHLGDVFINVSDPVSNRSVISRRTRTGLTSGVGLTTSTLRRLFEQIFNGGRYVPSKHEVAMGYAYSAALRSANLARRVGAAIVTPDGTLLATGYNDVPAPGGGQYPVEREDGVVLDARDDNFTPRVDRVLDPDDMNHNFADYGYDANDLIKYEIFDDLMERLVGCDLVDSSISARDLLFTGPNQVLAEEARKYLLKAELFDVIEFSRSVHAEMSALMSALRHQIPVRGCHLYSTTFPCHECARHIIAAGIDRVVYVEPYPKSRVSSLHADAICMGQRSQELTALDRRPVEFIPFIGITLAQQADLFSPVKRKDAFGDRFPPGRAREKKESTSISPESPLRWLSKNAMASELAAAQRSVAENIALREFKSTTYFH